MMSTTHEKQLLAAAVAGDEQALEQVLHSVQDRVFNLSLRMLGTIPDAEDAAQEILIKVMTHLSSFRGDSALSTWVYRIAVNHLTSCQKGMFKDHPLSFEEYGADILSDRAHGLPDLSGGVDRALLAHELKLSCTCVMLQCLDVPSRAVYILGTMFGLDSRTAAQILGTTPQAYRQKLSRTRKKMAAFLGAYCGLGGGPCRCADRVDYAVASHRIDPQDPGFCALHPASPQATAHTGAMEELDALSQVFADLPHYRSTQQVSDWVHQLVRSKSFRTAVNGQGGDA